MSKKGGSSGGSNKAADAQVALAQKLIDQTDPLRTSLIGRSSNFLSGGMDMSGTPGYAALKDSVGDQFASARDSIISSTPEGGALFGSLAKTQGQEASALTQGSSQLYDQELERALRLGTGGASEGSSALGQAGAIQAQLAAAKAQENAGKMGALGTGAGAYLGGKGGGGGSK